MIIAGIDPGQKGAIAFTRVDGAGDREGFEVLPLPYEDFSEGGRILDSCKLHRIIYDIIAGTQEFIFILEKAQPMPDQGGNSIFNYGRDFGMLIAICKLFALTENENIKFVHPATWKSKLGLRGLGKDGSINLAKELFPGVNLLPTPRCRKDSDGMAEALLIAEYGRRYCLSEIKSS